MNGPYINDFNYLYGINECIHNEPSLPKYNSTLHHKKPGIREIPTDAIRDDGFPYSYESYYSQSNPCKSCNKCNKIIRSNFINNIINIESKVNKILNIKLYGVTKDLDTSINLYDGNKYCISYITEHGLETVTGIFKGVSTNTPDECTRYIGNFDVSSSAAYIALDCSTEGNSDKRLIYISSIRYINEILDDSSDPYKYFTEEEKLRALVTSVTSAITNINTYIESHTQETSSDDQQNNEDDNTNSENSENNNCSCNGHHHKPPFHNPFIPYGWYPYNGGPLIIDRRPHFCFACPPPDMIGDNANNDEIENNITPDTILDALNTIKQMINTYLLEYENNKNNNGCCCPCSDKTTNTESDNENNTENP